MNSPQDPDRRPASAGAHEAPPGAALMNRVRWLLVIALSALAIVSVVAYVAGRRGGNAATVREAVLYRCPMHPAYTSDRPGECPICGMALERVEAVTPAVRASAGNVPGMVDVTIGPERIQRIGVRTAIVEFRDPGSAEALYAFITPDENRLHRVQLRVSGWVERIHGGSTGERVRRGQPLVTIYSPELLQGEQEFLIASEGGALSDPATAEAARRRLELLGVPGAELDRLARERRAVARLTLASPASGVVLERAVSEGQYVGPETALLVIGDLSRVWAVADVFEGDVATVRPGARATFRADGGAGEVWTGRVELVSPTIAPESRTRKLRVVIENRSGALRPGMYGRVSLADAGPPVPSVPAEAVIRAGEDRYVLLARAGGRFEPRIVTVGREGDAWIEILHGVAPGDTVVASASFLIDSESRLRAAIEGLASAPRGEHAGHGGRP